MDTKEISNAGDSSVVAIEKPAYGSFNWFEEVFDYHAPDDLQKQQYAAIREAAIQFGKVIIDNSPKCADQQAAIRHIRMGVHAAKSAIALKGLV